MYSRMRRAFGFCGVLVDKIFMEGQVTFAVMACCEVKIDFGWSVRGHSNSIRPPDNQGMTSEQRQTGGLFVLLMSKRVGMKYHPGTY